MRKIIIIDSQETNYEICNNGQCFNRKTQKELTGTVKNTGYRMVNLTVNGHKKCYSIHRLVAEAFLPNPDDKKYVNHIDGNRLNNNVSNLEWVTPSENTKHALTTGLKKVQRGKQNKYFEDLPNEIWMPYLDTNYSVSNKGRIKHNLNHNLLKGSIQDNGYLRCTLRINNQNKVHLIHKLVYFTFFPNQQILPNYVINHKDGNKLNNDLTNLEYVSNAENVLHSKYCLTTKSTKECEQYDLDGNYIATFKSLSEAARSVGGVVSGISLAASNKIKSYNGYIWKLKEA